MISTLAAVRRALLLVLVIGLLGIGVELLLLKHTDGAWQLAPLILIALALFAIGWYVVAKSTASVRALQFVMVLFVASGGIGAILHFRGNVSYERDSNPSLSGIQLYKSALMGSTPSLAPGAMLQLGLIGLLFTYRHPALSLASRAENDPTERDAL